MDSLRWTRAKPTNLPRGLCHHAVGSLSPPPLPVGDQEEGQEDEAATPCPVCLNLPILALWRLTRGRETWKKKLLMACVDPGPHCVCGLLRWPQYPIFLLVQN